MPPGELKSNLAGFVSFAQKLKGHEKNESQTFLEWFFRALGDEGRDRARRDIRISRGKKPGAPQLGLITGNGATPRVKGAKKFADLFWRDRAPMIILRVRRLRSGREFRASGGEEARLGWKNRRSSDKQAPPVMPTPEELARQNIDALLQQCGWIALGKYEV